MIIIDTNYFVEEVVAKIMHGKYGAIAFDINIALPTDDSRDGPILDFNQILCVISDERMGEIPKVGADYSANAISDGLVVAVEHFDDAVIVGRVISVVVGRFVGVGVALTAVRVDDVAAESFFYFGPVGVRKG